MPIDGGKPVLVFDVNETLLDIDALIPLFEGIFGRGEAMREWFAQLVLYSQALSLAGRYAPFNVLGGTVLRMVGATHDLVISDADVRALGTGIAALPLHADVADALARLRDAGFRLFTLTNSPEDQQADPLRRAGVAGLFERRFTVDAVRRFKPAPETYAMVARELDLPAASMCMIAAHVWDTIGAQSAGCMAALVTRPGNAALPLTGLVQSDFIGPDLSSITDQLLERWD